jgi:hypothetical protein
VRKNLTTRKAEELMTNELAIRSQAGLAAFAQDNDMVMIAGDLLTFKKGKWFRGQEEFDPADLHFLANYREAYTGWTRWVDKKPVEHRLIRCVDYQRKATRETLGHLDKNAWEANDRGVPQDPWQPSDRMILRTMDSAQDLLTFVSSSVGGRNAIAKLLGKVAQNVQAYEGNKLPVVVLETGTYSHDDFGTVAYPIFKIVDWGYWDGEQKGNGTPVDEFLEDEIPF